MGEACSHLICKNGFCVKGMKIPMRIFSRNPTMLLQGNQGNYCTLLSWLSRKKDPLSCEYITSCPKRITSQRSAISRPPLKENTHRISARQNDLILSCSFTLQHVSAAIASLTKKKKRMRWYINTPLSSACQRKQILNSATSFKILIVKIWT